MELKERESRAISSSPSTGIRMVRSSVSATCSTARVELVDGAQPGTGDPQAGRARADDADAGDEERARSASWLSGSVTCSIGAGDGDGDTGCRPGRPGGRWV